MRCGEEVFASIEAFEALKNDNIINLKILMNEM